MGESSMSDFHFFPHLIHLGVAYAVIRLLLTHRLRIPMVLRFSLAATFLTGAFHYLYSFDGNPWSTFALLGAVVLALCTTPHSKVAQEISHRLDGTATKLFVGSCLLSLFVVSIHAPAEAYLSSPEEFGILPSQWVVPNLQLAMKMAYPLLLLFPFAFTKRLRAFFAFFSFYCAVAVFCYAYFVPLGYPMMSGLSFERFLIDADMARMRLFKDLAIGFVVGGLTGWTALRVDARKIAMALFLVGGSLVAISTVKLVGLSRERFEPKKAAEDAKPFVFSRDHENVLLVYLDRFMGGFVERILEDDPSLASRLDGFTWYPRSVSAGINTIAGMPPVLGGYDYLPHIMEQREVPLVQLTTEAFKILPLNFTKKGYEFNFVNPRGLGWSMVGDCRFLNEIPGVNCTHFSPSVIARLANQLDMDVSFGSLRPRDYVFVLRRLGWMRALPYVFKDRVYDNGRWQPAMVANAGVTFREWAQLKALPDLTSLSSEKPQFNVVWSILPHEPDYIGPDCRPTSAPAFLSEAELEAHGYASLRHYNHYLAAKCSLMLVADYLDELKHLGVYDNTRIAIVSDHGIIGGVEDQSVWAVAGGTTEDFQVAARSVLLVKEEGRRGDVRVDDSFMPGADTPRILCEQIGGCVNPFLDNKSIDRHGREDPFVVSVTAWQFSRQHKTRFDVKERRELVGKDPFDASGWHKIATSR